jgi:hypothetical protein
METGVELIAEEREKQITKHGFTGEHHACHPEWYSDNQLIEASVKIGAPIPYDIAPKGWDKKWFTNLCNRPHKERLIISAALIAAELDRQRCL